MQTYLIVIEVAGAGTAYHALPFRIAGSLDEAMELMRDYIAHPDDDPCPDFFLVYEERGGTFLGEPQVFTWDVQPADAEKYQDFLRQTGRI